MVATGQRAQRRRRALPRLPRDGPRPGPPRGEGDLTAAQIPVATPTGVVDVHALRVTYGTLLARAGVSLAQAQKLMRHSTPALTANYYVKLEMDDAREAVGRIDVGGGKSKQQVRGRRAAGDR